MVLQIIISLGKIEVLENNKILSSLPIPAEKVQVVIDKEVKYKKPKVHSKTLKVKNDKVISIVERDKDGNVISTLNPEEIKAFKNLKIEKA